MPRRSLTQPRPLARETPDGGPRSPHPSIDPLRVYSAEEVGVLSRLGSKFVRREVAAGALVPVRAATPRKFFLGEEVLRWLRSLMNRA